MHACFCLTMSSRKSFVNFCSCSFVAVVTYKAINIKFEKYFPLEAKESNCKFYITLVMANKVGIEGSKIRRALPEKTKLLSKTVPACESFCTAILKKNIEDS